MVRNSMFAAMFQRCKDTKQARKNLRGHDLAMFDLVTVNLSLFILQWPLWALQAVTKVSDGVHFGLILTR